MFRIFLRSLKSITEGKVNRRHVVRRRRRNTGRKFLLLFIFCLCIFGVLQWRIMSLTVLHRSNAFGNSEWWKFRNFVTLSYVKQYSQGINDRSSYPNKWDATERHSTQFRPFYDFFAENYFIDKSPIKEWISGNKSYCNGSFIGFAKHFAYIKDVVFDPMKCHGRKGGEDIKSVINQTENDEYMRFTEGVFNIYSNSKRCKHFKKYNFLEGNHLRQWITKTILVNSTRTGSFMTVPGLTIAVQRYEYVNLYHTLTDWYNVFLMLMIFKNNPIDVTILWVDGHPAGGLDHVWTTMFNDVIRVGQLPGKVLFKNLVWAIPGYFSQLMNHALLDIPYFEEFRHFVISSFGIDYTQDLNCSKLSILFIWRHNYIAHPRNPTGNLQRKIKNEDELLISLNTTFQNYTIDGIQPDLHQFSKQLHYIMHTDILIGMHGAGLSLATFLPKNRALLELFPIYSSNLLHFNAIARWRNLYYESFQNTDVSNEYEDFYTRIPPDKVIEMIKRARDNICMGKM